MSWFSKKTKGVDIQVLKRTKYWNDIERLIETDKNTHSILVQYVYEQVSVSMIGELDRLAQEADKMTLVQEARNYIAHRIELLTKYKELAYGRNDTETKKS